MHSAQSSRSRHPARRAAALLGAVVMVVTLGAGCTGQAKTPDAYGDTTQKNFLRGCTEETQGAEIADFALSDADDMCVCVYDAISDEKADTYIPFDDFKALNDDLSDDPGAFSDQGETGQKFQAVTDDCVSSTAG